MDFYDFNNFAFSIRYYSLWESFLKNKMKKIKLILSLLISLFLLISFVSAHAGENESLHHDGYGMMGMMGAYGVGWMFFCMVIGILVIVLLVLLIVWLIKQIQKK